MRFAILKKRLLCVSSFNDVTFKQENYRLGKLVLERRSVLLMNRQKPELKLFSCKKFKDQAS